MRQPQIPFFILDKQKDGKAEYLHRYPAFVQKAAFAFLILGMIDIHHEFTCGTIILQRILYLPSLVDTLTVVLPLLCA